MENLLPNILEVAKQVLQLFILMGVGVLCGRAKWFSVDGAKQMTSILLKPVLFCIIVESFVSVEFTKETAGYLLTGVVACIVCTIIGGVIASLTFHKAPSSMEAVLKFGTVFSNCGFMSLPLVDALLGSVGVFVVSIYVGVFQCLCWTYGVAIYHYFDKKKAIKQIFCNPGIISITVGLILFFAKVKLPDIVMQPVEMLADLNTPLAMLVTGFYLSKMKVRLQKGDGQIMLSTLLRLVVIPLLTMGVLYCMKIRGFLLVACMVPICAPAASNTSLFAVMFDQDEVYASRLISVCTFLSIFTMPVIVAIAQLT